MKWRNGSVLLALGLAASAASADMITFDEGGAAEKLFVNTVALEGPYMATGVVFAGPAVAVGGAIVNESGGWKFAAPSGPNFLGFNASSGYAVGPETITFPSTADEVKIWVSSQHLVVADGFLLQAYDGSDNLLDTDAVTTANWAQLVVAAPGIKKVVLSAPTTDGIWTADNLEFRYAPVPLPTTAAMAALGAGATLIRRRRAAKAS